MFLPYFLSGGKKLTLIFTGGALFSVGSACHAKGIEPSYVLRALGLTDELAQCAVRFSFGRFTTFEEIDFVVEQLNKL